MGERFIGLVRVSTDEQGKSGLGLAAGVHDLNGYVAQCQGELIQVLEEVGSGRKNALIDRPTLLKALMLCKRHRATLLIPKVDRLVRSTEVHTDIKRSGVPFRAVDNPHANEFTLDILVAVAAQEGRAISDRTKRALLAYKRERRISKRIREMYGGNVPPEIVEATAGKLGSDLVGCKLTNKQRDKGREKAMARSRRESLEPFSDILPDMQKWRSEGLPYQAIANRLNGDGVPTRMGFKWGPTQVKRILDRLASA